MIDSILKIINFGLSVDYSEVLFIYRENNDYIVKWEEYFNPHDNSSTGEFETISFLNSNNAVKCFLELIELFRNKTGGYYLLGNELAYFKRKYEE